LVKIATCCKMHRLLDTAGIRGTLKRLILKSEMLSGQCWRVALLWSGWASNRLLPAVSYTGKWRRLTTRLAGLPASHGRSPKESRRPSKCTVAHPTPSNPLQPCMLIPPTPIWNLVILQEIFASIFYCCL